MFDQKDDIIYHGLSIIDPNSNFLSWMEVELTHFAVGSFQIYFRYEISFSRKCSPLMYEKVNLFKRKTMFVLLVCKHLFPPFLSV